MPAPGLSHRDGTYEPVGLLRRGEHRARPPLDGLVLDLVQILDVSPGPYRASAARIFASAEP